jgi:hypothetical protein
MKDKFSYFDFICYSIPGALLIWSIVLFAKGFNILTSFVTFNEIIDTLGFIIIAFILGHFIQYKAKQKLEPKIKRKFWGGVFFSEHYLLKNKKFCSEIDRMKFLKMAKERFGYTEDELKNLDNDSEKAKKLSHTIYRKSYALINNEGVAERAAMANSYYNFFKGLSIASFYSANLFLAQFLLKVLENITSWSCGIIKEDLAIPLLLTVFFFYLKGCFENKARQRGELHIEQTFNSAYVLYTGGKNNGK